MARRTSARTLQAKVVLVGHQSVGKTSLLTRYVSGDFDVNVRETIGASFFPKEMDVDGISLTLNIWDTAGMERFRAMAPMYYRDADAAMVVYDITRRDTFEAVSGWIDELRSAIDPDRLVLCVCGNKCDLDDQREILTQDGKALAESLRTHFMETSALSAAGVSEMFSIIGKDIVRSKAHQKASEGDPSILLGFAHEQQKTPTTSTNNSKKCFGGCAN